MDTRNVINFLNEVGANYPEAISFAAGRPNTRFMPVAGRDEYQQSFDNHLKANGKSGLHSFLTHYGPSRGVINDLLSSYLKNDFAIDCPAEAINVTNGCQEGFALVCMHELKQPDDCLINISPGFVGLYGLVEMLGKPVEHIDVNDLMDPSRTTLDLNYLERQIAQIKARGLNPKLLYINPDFNNPLSYCISNEDRQRLLTLCADNHIKIIEDAIYATFGFTTATTRPRNAQIHGQPGDCLPPQFIFQNLFTQHSPGLCGGTGQ